MADVARQIPVIAVGGGPRRQVGVEIGVGVQRVYACHGSTRVERCREADVFKLPPVDSHMAQVDVGGGGGGAARRIVAVTFHVCRGCQIGDAHTGKEFLKREACGVDAEVVALGFLIPSGVERHLSAGRSYGEVAVDKPRAVVDGAPDGHWRNADGACRGFVENTVFDEAHVADVAVDVDAAVHAVEIKCVGHHAVGIEAEAARHVHHHAVDAETSRSAAYVGVDVDLR